MTAAERDQVSAWLTDETLEPDVLAVAVRLGSELVIGVPPGADRALVGDHVARHRAGDRDGLLWRCTTAGCERLA